MKYIIEIKPKDCREWTQYGKVYSTLAGACRAVSDLGYKFRQENYWQILQTDSTGTKRRVVDGTCSAEEYAARNSQ